MNSKYASCIVIYMLCIAGVKVTTAHHCNEDIPGYYWRNFAGTMPDDALPGGRDVDDKAIYIGKVLHGDKLIPAKIYQGSDIAYFELGGAQSTTKNIEVLCTQSPENFEWIPTTSESLHLLTNKHIVNGGYQEELNVATYIGRAVIKGETSVGKVLAGSNEYDGLWTVHDDENVHFTSFEILTYNKSD